jgi:hypothetical protein
MGTVSSLGTVDSCPSDAIFHGVCSTLLARFARDMDVMRLVRLNLWRIGTLTDFDSEDFNLLEEKLGSDKDLCD